MKSIQIHPTTLTPTWKPTLHAIAVALFAVVAHGPALPQQTGTGGPVQVPDEKWAEEVVDVGLRLSRAFRSFCDAKPSIDADLMPFGAGARGAEARWVVPGGAAHSAGIRNRDLISSVNGVSLPGLSFGQLSDAVLKPALAKSLASKEPLVFVRLSRTDLGATEAVKIVVEENCLVNRHVVITSLTNSRGFEDAIATGQARNLIAFDLARRSVPGFLEAQSAGKALQTGVLVLRLLGAIAGKPLPPEPSSAPRWFSEGDNLKGEFLAMSVLQAEGFSIAKYLDYIGLEKASALTSDPGGPMRNYDAGALEKIAKIHALVLRGDPGGAAALAGFSLTTLQLSALKNSPTKGIAPNKSTKPEMDMRPQSTGFAQISDVDAVPGLSERCRNAYRQFVARPIPKAFAIGPKGACQVSINPTGYTPAMRTDHAQFALGRCGQDSGVECKLYAVDNEVVWIASEHSGYGGAAARPQVVISGAWPIVVNAGDSASSALPSPVEAVPAVPRVPIPSVAVSEAGPKTHNRIIPTATGFAAGDDADAVPVREEGKPRYRHYLTLPSPKAFVVYEDGSWRWVSNSEEAMTLLLDRCAREDRKCWLYAVEDRIVWHKDAQRRIERSNQLEKE